MTDRTGACLCGDVSYTAKDMGDTFSMCHCDMCKRWSGSAFKGIPVRNENLAITGATNIRIYKSSDWAERANCSTCGSALWYKITDGPYIGSTSLTVGSLASSEGLTMAREYFVDYKNSADELPEDRVQMTEDDVMAMFASSEEN